MTARTQKRIVVGGASLLAVAPTLVAFLGLWEGTAQYTVYKDRLANDIPTVCKGITQHVTSTPLVVGEKWSKQKCEEEEALAIFRVQTKLAVCFKLPPQQEVFNMATSHAWNNGVANTCSSLAMAAFNAGDWELGCQRLSKSDAGKHVWSYVRTGKMLPDGKPEYRFIQGLANRRAAETSNCLASLQ